MDKFKSGILLREVANLHDRFQRETAACCGSTSTQCEIITHLGRNGPMTLADLGRSLGLDKGWVSRSVKLLAQEGILVKEAGDPDRRTIRVTLSKEGEARLAEIDDTLNGLSDRVMQRIPARRRTEVYSALEELSKALQAELKPQPATK